MSEYTEWLDSLTDEQYTQAVVDAAAKKRREKMVTLTDVAMESDAEMQQLLDQAGKLIDENTEVPTQAEAESAPAEPEQKAGSYQQMVNRRNPEGDPDFYPTPKWITRALIEFLHARGVGLGTIWEPACGEGHMVEAMQEYGYQVMMSDLFAEAAGMGPEYAIDFVDPAAPPAEDSVDWVITNPPYGFAKYAVEGKKTPKRVYRPDRFMLNGINVGRAGSAMLVRTNMIAGEDRIQDIYQKFPPTFVVQFPKRLNFHKGKMKKSSGGMVDFCWMIWVNPDMYPQAMLPAPGTTELAWFGCDAEDTLTKDGDYPEAAA